MKKWIAIKALSAALVCQSALAQDEGSPEALEARPVISSQLDFYDPYGPRLENPKEARPMQADYPPPAWVAGQEGIVVYEIAVTEQGKATNCTIVESSGSELLDTTTCAIVMERAVFSNAFDKEGKPVAANFKGRHIWERREPEFPGNFEFQATFLIDELGQAKDCEVEAVSGTLPSSLARTVKRNPCPFGANRSSTPYRDENGNPISKRLEVRISAEVTGLEPKPD
ncbi:MAG: energy transducer TonB [Pseudomonadota bacterium]